MTRSPDRSEKDRGTARWISASRVASGKLATSGMKLLGELEQASLSTLVCSSPSPSAPQGGTASHRPSLCHASMNFTHSASGKNRTDAFGTEEDILLGFDAGLVLPTIRDAPSRSQERLPAWNTCVLREEDAVFAGPLRKTTNTSEVCVATSSREWTLAMDCGP